MNDPRIIANEDAIYLDGEMVIQATGGPDDPIQFLEMPSGTELESDDLRRFQEFILNFLETGFFNQEA